MYHSLDDKSAHSVSSKNMLNYLNIKLETMLSVLYVSKYLYYRWADKSHSFHCNFWELWVRCMFNSGCPVANDDNDADMARKILLQNNYINHVFGT